MIKFRWQRGSLEESMKTVVELEDRNALVRHVLEGVDARFKDRLVLHDDDRERVRVTEYCMDDDRIDWKRSNLVTLDSMAVGLTDAVPTSSLLEEEVDRLTQCIENCARAFIGELPLLAYDINYLPKGIAKLKAVEEAAILVVRKAKDLMVMMTMSAAADGDNVDSTLPDEMVVLDEALKKVRDANA